MTEQTNAPSELETLKARADMMGIKYHPATGVDKLKARINAALDAESEESNQPKKPLMLKKNSKLLTNAEYVKAKREKVRRDAAKLVRVRITSMDPNKREWEGEVISAGSAKLGTFKKYIPFNVEWHIPQIMLDALKEKRCSIFHTVKDHLGNKVRKAKLVPAYNIEVLPPLSKEELKDLAEQQAMAHSIDE